ncbi:retrotransposon ty3-gypsy subclass [Hordeum vulgare]|nr:retrotransposon ty3-gypsy subclass [Hordeum vulgare]
MVHFDGSRKLEGSGTGVVLTSPRGDKFCYVLELMFRCTNNVAEYEALLHGLRIAKEMNLSRVGCLDDSYLVAQQVSGTWDSKDPLIAAYRRPVTKVASYFHGYQLIILIIDRMRRLMLFPVLGQNVSMSLVMCSWMFCITLP